MPSLKPHTDNLLRRFYILANSGDIKLLKAACIEEDLPITIDRLDDGSWGAVIPRNTWELASPDARLGILAASKTIQQRLLRLTPWLKTAALVFLWMPSTTLLETFTFKLVWAWHVTPWLGVAAPSFKVALAVLFLVNSAIFKSPRLRVSQVGDPLSNGTYAIPYISCLIALSIAWLLK